MSLNIFPKNKIFITIDRNLWIFVYSYEDKMDHYEIMIQLNFGSLFFELNILIIFNIQIIFR